MSVDEGYASKNGSFPPINKSSLDCSIVCLMDITYHYQGRPACDTTRRGPQTIPNQLTAVEVTD